MCIYTHVQEHNDMPHDPLTRVSECSVAGSAPEKRMTTMVSRVGVETRSAMACYVDLADYTASADKAYADAEATVWRMDACFFRSLEGVLAINRLLAPSGDAGRGAAQWLKAAYAECTRDG